MPWAGSPRGHPPPPSTSRASECGMCHQTLPTNTNPVLNIVFVIDLLSFYVFILEFVKTFFLRTIFCFLEPHPPELYLICAFKKWHRPDTVCCSLLFGRGGIASKTQCILFSGCKALTVAAAYRQALLMPTVPPLLAPGCFQPAVRCDGSHTALVHTCRTFSRVNIPRSGMAAPWNQGSADDLLEGPSHL